MSTDEKSGGTSTNMLDLANSERDNANSRENSEQQHFIASLKFPPFWSNRPDLWFLQVETQFRIKGITSSSTKYDHLVASLPSDTMEIVADALLNPPSQNKYENLKKLLLQRTRDSEERRLDELLHKVELGNYKPSELYRHMESLAGGNSLVNNSLLKKLWINKLPSSMQACVIAIEDSQSLEEIFNIADKIFDTRSATKISSVSTGSMDTFQKNLVKSIQELSNRLKQLEIRQSRHRSRSQSFNRARSRSQSNNRFQFQPHSQKQHPENVCWYHQKFKTRARKCIQPCKFNNNQSEIDDTKN